MGIVIDTDVLVLADRADSKFDFTRYASFGTAFISAMTAFELLVGVHGHAVLTRNGQDFRRLPGVSVLDFETIAEAT